MAELVVIGKKIIKSLFVLVLALALNGTFAHGTKTAEKHDLSNLKMIEQEEETEMRQTLAPSEEAEKQRFSKRLHWATQEFVKQQEKEEAEQ